MSDHNLALNLDPAEFMVQFSGRRGANVSTLRGNMEIISDFEPHIVVLQIGSNDLCNQANSAEMVAGAIFALAEHIVTKFKPVQRVVMMQILHRMTPSRPVRYKVDIDMYDDKVDQVNSILATLARDHMNVRYWKHKGLFQPHILQLALEADGTHLNWSQGYPKYFKNIRAAIVSMRNELSFEKMS